MLRISAKVDYGLRALADIARADGGRVTTADIARREAIPHKFLGATLTELAKAGLVRGRRGADGGYHLARPADQITLAEVIEVLEGALVEVPLAAGSTALGAAWSRVEDGLSAALGALTIADLANS